MESWPQNPEFRNNPEDFHPCCVKCTKFKTYAILQSFHILYISCEGNNKIE